MKTKRRSFQTITRFIVAALTIIFACGCLTACEQSGVPGAQIESDFNKYGNSWTEYSNISYKHNVDTRIHKDCVLVSYDIEYKYMTIHEVTQFDYFYDRSSDIWTLDNVDEISSEYRLKKELSGANFSGYIKGDLWSPGFRYEINVISINSESAEITISYKITIDGSDTIQSQATLTPNRWDYVVKGRGMRCLKIRFDYDKIFAYYGPEN